MAASFPRTPDTQNYMLVTYIDDPQPWEEAAIGAEGRGLANNIPTFWNFAMDNDLVCARISSIRRPTAPPNAHARSPALRIVETNDEGIVVNGVKRSAPARPSPTSCTWACSSAPASGRSDHLRREPGQYQGRHHRLPRERGEGRSGRASAGLAGDELDIRPSVRQRPDPLEYVFHIGNPDHAKLYPQRVFDWVHYHALVRQAVRAELMAGLAILISEHLGTSKIEAVQSRLAKSSASSSDDRARAASRGPGFYTPGRPIQAGHPAVQLGPRLFPRELRLHGYELVDLCGRSAMLFPTESQWQDSKIGPR